MMRDYFRQLTDILCALLADGECFSAYFQAEDSDFVRFNQGRIRQLGRVHQRFLTVDLIRGQRHASGELGLAGDLQQDRQRLMVLLADLREMLPLLAEDPHLHLPSSVSPIQQMGTLDLPETAELVGEILAAVAGHDMVGILASGPQYHGFCDAEGLFHWHQQASFNLDYSLYWHEDRAVKARYAGSRWDSQEFAVQLASVVDQLALCSRPLRSLRPGDYRAFVSPGALEEITDLLGWGAFSVQAQRTRSTPLLAMIEGDACLDPRVSLGEDLRGGIAAGFQSAGFPRPEQVPLISAGRYCQGLVSPRSAVEYGLRCNGANAAESPVSLAMAPGDLATDEALSALDQGLYISNLWYLNYSDRNAGRITGMTRFGTFWVEGGIARQPVEVMRFDDTIYRILGSSLEGLTRERSLLLDPGSYESRSSRSSLLPGLLLSAFSLTL